jgi:hypothetical protein
MADADSLVKRRTLMAAIGIGAALALWFGFIGCGNPPQMGADKEVFATVDALFTAVTARSETLLSQCERGLRGQRDAGKLPTHASDYLNGIIQKARAGEWKAAAERLYEFMQVQRRDGR